MKIAILTPNVSVLPQPEIADIAELADRVGVPTSTVRYYERVGLLEQPARTPSGYRDYDEDAAARLLFVSRARNMGLSCEQITELLPIWNGTNCGAAQERVSELIDEKQAEIAERIAELERFEREKVEDFKSGVETFLESAVEAQKEVCSSCFANCHRKKICC